MRKASLFCFICCTLLGVASCVAPKQSFEDSPALDSARQTQTSSMKSLITRLQNRSDSLERRLIQADAAKDSLRAVYQEALDRAVIGGRSMDSAVTSGGENMPGGSGAAPEPRRHPYRYRQDEDVIPVRRLERVEIEAGSSPRPEAPNATVAYSYFTDILQGSTKDLRVMVKVLEPQVNVERDLDSVQHVQEVNSDPGKVDTNVIKSLIIKGYKYLTVLLKYDSAEFTVDTDYPAKQTLDSVNGNFWHWRVKAISAGKTAKIEIHVLAESDKNGAGQQDERDIAVKINIDHVTAIRRALIWLAENPKTSITGILLPVVGWLFGRRKKGDKSEQSAAIS